MVVPHIARSSGDCHSAHCLGGGHASACHACRRAANVSQVNRLLLLSLKLLGVLDGKLEHWVLCSLLKRLPVLRNVLSLLHGLFSGLPCLLYPLFLFAYGLGVGHLISNPRDACDSHVGKRVL